MNRQSIVFVLLHVVVLGGCDRSNNVTIEGEVGQRMSQDVQNSPPYPSWALDSASALRIGGGLQGQAEHQFSDIRFAATLSDGQIVVVDGGSSEIRWFDREGKPNAQAGRSGRGPGDLRRVKAGTVLRGDTLLLFDGSNQLLNWFDPGGVLARSRRLNLGATLGVSVQELDSGALLVSVESPEHNFGGSEYNYARDSVFAVLISDSFEPDTVLRLPGNEAVTWVDYVDGRAQSTRQMDLPFGHGTLLGGLGNSIVVVETGPGGLTLFSKDGVLRHSSYRSDLESPAVSSESRERYIDAAVEDAVALGLPAAYARTGAEERLNLLPEGRRAPVYDRMLLDQVAGRIWLRDFVPLWAEEEPQAWTIHDETGRVLARLLTPAQLEVMHVGRGQLVGVNRDAMGVEHVAVYQVRQLPG